MVPSTIALALGVADRAGDSIKAFAQDKQLLLVLDNFEHVSAAAPFVAELIVACPRLKVLATSRVPLRLAGEHTLVVPPMALPDGSARTGAALGECDAVKLFVARAQAANQDFVLTDESASIVAEVCRRVDGLPLAIELAAARVRVLSPWALLGRMPPFLPLLTDGPRDAPARQQTLRNTIAWSYVLLNPAEQMLFRRLAVFRGCTLDAAEAVCGATVTTTGSTSIAAAPLSVDVLEGMSSLVDKSLLRHEPLPNGEPWYIMLETIREFALEQLTDNGESDVIQRRHVLHYLQLAESRERKDHTGQEGAWHARIEREHDNLRAALDCCLARGYVEPGFRLALALWWFWMVCGHLSEGRTRFTALFSRFPLREVGGPRAAQRARALGAAGTLASVHGEFAVSRALHEEGVTIWRRLGDRVGLAAALEGLVLSAATSGDYSSALETAQECLAISRELHDKLMIAHALYLYCTNEVSSERRGVPPKKASPLCGSQASTYSPGTASWRRIS
jgi:predicted ATPase